MGSVLVSQSVLDQIDTRPDDFYDRELGAVYRTARELHENGEPVDVVTLTAQGHDLELITRLINDTPTHMHAQGYASVVKDMAAKRKAVNIASSIAKKAHDTKRLDIADEVGQLEMLDKVVGSGPRLASHVASELWDRLEHVQSGGSVVVGTPWPRVNDLIGGLVVPEMAVLAARPSMGKTQFAIQLSDHLEKQGMRVLFHSMDTKDRGAVNRLALLRSGVDWMKFRTGRQTPDDESKYSQALADIMNHSSILVYDKRIPVDDFINVARAENRKDPLGMVVVDYLQRYPVSGRNRVAEFAEIAERLKELANMIDAPVLALSQLSRGVEHRDDKRPVLSDLRESGGIEQAADLVLTLYRDNYYTPMQSPDGSGTTEVAVLKSRDGVRGKKALLYWHAKELYFD